MILKISKYIGNFKFIFKSFSIFKQNSKKKTWTSSKTPTLRIIDFRNFYFTYVFGLLKDINCKIKKILYENLMVTLTYRIG